MRNAAPAWTCLLYHNVVPNKPELSGGPDWFSVSARAFDQQLDRIIQRDFLGCSIAEAMRRDGKPRIAITFDDGDAGQYQRAFPALAEREMTATFFIVTEWVGQPGYVSWDELRTMKDAGMSIQSHTCTHPLLTELPPERVAEELIRSKERLDRELGQDTDMIALPGGFFPRGSYRALAREAGYRVVATSNWGRNLYRSNPTGGASLVRRCTIKGAPGMDWFDRVLDGDPWVAARYILKEKVLEGFKTVLGPSRYLRWRARFLDRVGQVG
jgi:peptidoglycan/xylan/chitin deacetylase (PgdA/CDA1 family)